VPGCCNPDHLFLGTRGDNNRDRNQKGREGDRRGILNGRSKLTEQQVLEIRAATGTGQSIAAQYGVNQQMVSRIRLGQAWRHV
jgi:hypothetical protein